MNGTASLNARAVTSILGFWLFMSIFCWHHDPVRGFNDLVVGLALFTSGFCGTYFRSFRYLDAVLGCWMVLSFFVISANSLAERVHDGALGLLVIALAAVSSASEGGLFFDHWVALFDRNPRLERRV